MIMNENSATTRVTFVRHGHVYNPDNVIYGRLPGFELSHVGRQQAAAAAHDLRDIELSAVYCSPQQRAQQTAEIILHHHPNLSPITAPLIDEIRSYFEGRPAEEVEARGWDLYTGIGEGYEVPTDIGARGAKFVTDLRTTHTGQHIVAVSHGDVIAFTLLWAMGAPLQVALKRHLDHYGITDRYPATASLTTLIYSSQHPDAPPKVDYWRPYSDELIADTLS